MDSTGTWTPKRKRLRFLTTASNSSAAPTMSTQIWTTSSMSIGKCDSLQIWTLLWLAEVSGKSNCLKTKKAPGIDHSILPSSWPTHLPPTPVPQPPPTMQTTLLFWPDIRVQRIILGSSKLHSTNWKNGSGYEGSKLILTRGLLSYSPDVSYPPPRKLGSQQSSHWEFSIEGCVSRSTLTK